MYPHVYTLPRFNITQLQLQLPFIIKHHPQLPVTWHVAPFSGRAASPKEAALCIEDLLPFPWWPNPSRRNDAKIKQGECKETQNWKGCIGADRVANLEAEAAVSHHATWNRKRFAQEHASTRLHAEATYSRIKYVVCLCLCPGVLVLSWLLYVVPGWSWVCRCDFTLPRSAQQSKKHGNCCHKCTTASENLVVVLVNVRM